MKKFIFSVVAVIAMSTLLVAESYDAYGTDSYQASSKATGSSGSYVGLGYSYMKWNVDENQLDYDVLGNNLMLLAGYSFNEYIAVEGRYSFSVGDLRYDGDMDEEDFDGDMSNFSLFLKPMYSSGGFTVYGLIGYGQISDDSENEDSLQWGAGLSVDIYYNMDLFFDYTRLYDDEGGFGMSSDNDLRIESFNFGIAYSF